MAKIDLTSKEWCDVIFDGRNKTYGAYKIRIESSKRYLVSLLILVIIMSVPVFFHVVTSIVSKQQVMMTEVTQLSDLHRPDAIKDISFRHPKVNSLVKSAIVRGTPFSAPVIKQDADVDVSKELASQDKLASDTVVGYSPSNEVGGQTVTVNNGNEDDFTDTKIFQIVQQLPEYPGGMSALVEFLTKNLRYPSSAVRDSIQGRVIAQFIIHKDGSISDIKILHHLSKECDQEALRVLNMMKKWKPGIEHNKPVDVKFVVPVEYKF
jgi:periplasmic protein TonB